MFSDFQMFWRFSTGLRRFLGTPLSPDACRVILAESLEHRENNFLQLIRRAVYEFPASPYLPLLRQAGIGFEDLRHLVEADGVEAALIRLRDEGVLISFEEFKGMHPIERTGLRLDPRAADFDNPLLLREFTLLTGGSSGRRRRLNVDLDLLVYEAASQFLFLESHGLLEHPLGLWRPVPPGSSGIKHALRSAKVQRPVSRWFDLSAGAAKGPWQSVIFLKMALWQSRRASRYRGESLLPVPFPVPTDRPEPVLQWLADCRAKGLPAVLSCPASAAVRLSHAAIEQKLEIAGTIFWVGGEAITSGKMDAITASGARTINGWSLSETGPIAVGCANRGALDEVHLLNGKVAAIPISGGFGDTAGEPGRLLLSTLLPASPKIMLNVDIGDSAVFNQRRCGCPIERAGFLTHLHTIRAENKLTAGGMQFLQADLLQLVEQVLPATHGGSAVHYQFVERESRGMPIVEVRVSPAVGDLHPDDILGTVTRFLSGRSRGNAMMVNHWLSSGTLAIVRRDPHVSPVGKTPPLWIMREE